MPIPPPPAPLSPSTLSPSDRDALPTTVPAVLALALAALALFPGLLPGDDDTAPAPTLSGTSIGDTSR